VASSANRDPEALRAIHLCCELERNRADAGLATDILVPTRARGRDLLTSNPGTRRVFGGDWLRQMRTETSLVRPGSPRRSTFALLCLKPAGESAVRERTDGPFRQQ
jgi:hypothetical protein